MNRGFLAGRSLGPPSPKGYPGAEAPGVLASRPTSSTVKLVDLPSIAELEGNALCVGIKDCVLAVLLRAHAQDASRALLRTDLARIRGGVLQQDEHQFETLYTVGCRDQSDPDGIAKYDNNMPWAVGIMVRGISHATHSPGEWARFKELRAKVWEKV